MTYITKKSKYTLGFILLLSLPIFTITGCTTTPNGETPIDSVEPIAKQTKLFEFTTETNSGVPLKDVIVTVNAFGAPEIAYSDDNGYVKVKIPSEGDVRINLEKEGYETQTITVNLNTQQSINRRYRLKKINQTQSNKVPADNPVNSNVTGNNGVIDESLNVRKKVINNSESRVSNSVEAQDFIFNIEECRQTSSDERKCTLLITNKIEERKLTLYGSYGRLGQSKIISSSGNEVIASQVTFGKKSNRAYVTRVMLTNIPLKATVVFKGVIENDINVVSITASSKSSSYRRFNVNFYPNS
jgi:hypothetical protein